MSEDKGRTLADYEVCCDITDDSTDKAAERGIPHDEFLLSMIDIHFGMKPRRDDTVFEPRTGRFHDVQRYRDFAKDVLTLYLRSTLREKEIANEKKHTPETGGSAHATSREDYERVSANSYFEARLQTEDADCREIFRAAFNSGWDARMQNLSQLIFGIAYRGKDDKSK